MLDIDVIARLSEHYEMPLENVLFIALNVHGVKLDCEYSRIRMDFRLTDSELFSYAKERGELDYFFALPVNPDSAFTLADDILSLNGTLIGQAINPEEDTSDLYYFRREIRATSFDDYLHEVAQKGIPLYGGSAGAIILGEDIRTAPEANHLEAKEVAGLSLVKSHSIFCHYKADDRDAAIKLSGDLRRNIIAIPEKAGGYVTDGVLTNYGTEPLVIARTDGVETVNPNQSVELRGWR